MKKMKVLLPILFGSIAIASVAPIVVSCSNNDDGGSSSGGDNNNNNSNGTQNIHANTITDIYTKVEEIISNQYSAENLQKDTMNYYSSYIDPEFKIKISKNEVAATKNTDGTFETSINLGWTANDNESISTANGNVSFSTYSMKLYPIMIKDKDFASNNKVNIYLLATQFNPLKLSFDSNKHMNDVLFIKDEPTEVFKIKINDCLITSDLEGIAQAQNVWYKKAKPLTSAQIDSTKTLFNSLEELTENNPNFDFLGYDSLMLIDPISLPMSFILNQQ